MGKTKPHRRYPGPPRQEIRQDTHGCRAQLGDDQRSHTDPYCQEWETGAGLCGSPRMEVEQGGRGGVGLRGVGQFVGLEVDESLADLVVATGLKKGSGLGRIEICRVGNRLFRYGERTIASQSSLFCYMER